MPMRAPRCFGSAAIVIICRWLPEPASKRREIFDGPKRRPWFEISKMMGR